MDLSNPTKRTLIRTIAVGILLFALLQTTRLSDLLSWLNKPAVMAVISVFGAEISDAGTHLIVGKLVIPWSRDCAGFDVLLVLWGLILWQARNQPVTRRLWLRLIGSVPAAVMANVMRVLTIIGWRALFYPAVESPQMHYFIGFLWLLPMIVLFVPRGEKQSISEWLCTMMLSAAALSLVAPQASAPGGVMVTASAILLLSTHHPSRLRNRVSALLALIWIGAAVGIAGAGMESLWLPWLLCCPWFVPKSAKLACYPLLMPCCVPVFVMSAPWLAGAAVVIALLILSRVPHTPAVESAQIPFKIAAPLSFALMIPFVASSLGPVVIENMNPPPGLMARPVEASSWVLRVPRQNPYVKASWHSPNGSGRHHTLPVCLSYRGKQLKPHPYSPKLFADDNLWYYESFLMPDGELCDYKTYLLRTLLPFSNPGIHLIASGNRTKISESEFCDSAESMFRYVADCHIDATRQDQ